MRRAVLSAVAAGISAAALLMTGIAAAAISPTYSMSGIGSAANTTQSRLVGTGVGSSGDRLTWRADLDHTALVASPGAAATITGGSLSAASRGGSSSQLGGTFTEGRSRTTPRCRRAQPAGTWSTTSSAMSSSTAGRGLHRLPDAEPHPHPGALLRAHGDGQRCAGAHADAGHAADAAGGHTAAAAAAADHAGARGVLGASRCGRAPGRTSEPVRSSVSRAGRRLVSRRTCRRR